MTCAVFNAVSGSFKEHFNSIFVRFLISIIIMCQSVFNTRQLIYANFQYAEKKSQKHQKSSYTYIDKSRKNIFPPYAGVFLVDAHLNLQNIE